MNLLWNADIRHIGPKERFRIWRWEFVKVPTDPRNDLAIGDIPVTVSPDFSWQGAPWKSYHPTKLLLTRQGDLLRASANSLHSPGGKHKQKFTSLHLEIPRVFSKPAVQQDWIWCWFWEGQPGGTSTWWKLVALSLIGGEFNFSNEPGTFLFLIRFAQWLTQQIFTWQTAQSIPVPVDWNHVCCYSHTGKQGHLKVIVAREM